MSGVPAARLDPGLARLGHQKYRHAGAEPQLHRPHGKAAERRFGQHQVRHRHTRRHQHHVGRGARVLVGHQLCRGPEVEAASLTLFAVSRTYRSASSTPLDAASFSGPALSRTYFCASSAPLTTASFALPYMSRPRSAQSPVVSVTLRMPSCAWVARLPACSDSWLRSSEPALGANNIPSPAPSTVPVRRPITKLLPPLFSFSKRS